MTLIDTFNTHANRKEIDFAAGHMTYFGDYYSIGCDSISMSDSKRKRGSGDASMTSHSRVTQYALPRGQERVPTDPRSIPLTASTTLPTPHLSSSVSAPPSMSITESSSSKKWKMRNRNKLIAVSEIAGTVVETLPTVESDSSDDGRAVHRRNGNRTNDISHSHFLSEATMKRSTYEMYRQSWIEDTIPLLLTTVSAMRCPLSQEVSHAMLRGMAAFRSDCRGIETETEIRNTYSVGGDRGVRQDSEGITLKEWLSESMAAHGPQLSFDESSIDANRGNFPHASGSSANCFGRNATNICAVVIDFQTETTRGSDVQNNAEMNNTGKLFLRPFEGGSSHVTPSTLHAQDSDRAVEEGLDVYLNVGGPIWTAAFVPDVTHPVSAAFGTGSRCVKYLAVGTSRVGWEGNSVTGDFNLGDDASYALGQKVLTRNLLQVWAVSKVKKVHAVSDRNDGPILMNRRVGAAVGVSSGVGGGVSSDGYNTHGQKEGLSEGVDKVQQDSAHLCYCVAVDRGPVWKIAWSPWVPSPFKSQSKGESAMGGRGLLGVLAVVCGDGSCLILVLPVPDTDHTPSRSSGVETVRLGDAMSVPVLSERSVCRFVLTVPTGFDPTAGSGSGGLVEVHLDDSSSSSKRENESDDLISILSVAWNAQKPLQLCCGLLNGNVAVFDLEPYLLGDARTTSTTPSGYNTGSVCTANSINPSSGVMDVPQGNLSVVPFILLSEEHSTPSNNLKHHQKAAVRSATFCPYHPHLILSSGYSSDVSVWNINNPKTPALVRSFPAENGWVYDAQWDPQGRGFYGGCSDRSAVRHVYV